VALAACDNPLSEPCRLPELLASAVSGLPGNVLGALVSVEVRQADSVKLRYRFAGAAGDSSVAAMIPERDTATIPLLGLLPDQAYSLTVMAFGPCGSVSSSALGFETGSLPDDLPAFVAGGPDPSPGYVAFGLGSYGLVIDNTGRVVWYHHFPTGPGLNFQAQPNGRYLARPQPASTDESALFVELDPLGETTRTFGCARGLPPRFHDLLVEPDGSYWLMCDETRTMDLSADGGQPEARVTGTVVQHVGAQGNLLFEWSPFDHFSLQDLDPVERAKPDVNWTHGNAIDLDADGNLLVSFRNLHEITKIDITDGTIIWRMGGRANQFTFENTPAPAFAAQHGLRATEAGHFVLLDNLGDASGSHAERYVRDEARRSVRLEGSQGGSRIAWLGGTTQPLPGGRTLVAYGNGGRVEEYDAAGTVVWSIEGNPGYVFRAQRIWSLYRPGVGSPR
jgi:hypothetical protein